MKHDLCRLLKHFNKNDVRNIYNNSNRNNGKQEKENERKKENETKTICNIFDYII